MTETLSSRQGPPGLGRLGRLPVARGPSVSGAPGVVRFRGRMRRGRDSNPRGFRLPLFESGTINHSDTSPHRSLTFECGQTATVSLSISGEYCPTRAEAVSFARWNNARWAAGTFSALPDHVFCALASRPRPYAHRSSHGSTTG